jgi:NAD(P)-dependent dehydrogenase (short-subunit alcohol dehydrogenase family)
MPRCRSGDGELFGVRVLVTGATSGIGRAMAEALVAAGAAVAITSRDLDRAERSAEEMSEGPGQAIGLAMDVRDDHQVGLGVSEVVERFGGLDVLVNNAGLGMRTVNPQFLTSPLPFWKVTPQAFLEVIATNLSGYFLVASKVVSHLLRAGRGRIVNITMNHATMRRRGFVPYGPSRAAAESLSQIMAADLAGTGVSVNMLLPGGATATGMIPEDAPAEVRWGLLSPTVMAAPICWLCSAAAEGVTGERIVATEFDRWLAHRTGPNLDGAPKVESEPPIPEL